MSKAGPSAFAYSDLPSVSSGEVGYSYLTPSSTLESIAPDLPLMGGREEDLVRVSFYLRCAFLLSFLYLPVFST